MSKVRIKRRILLRDIKIEVNKKCETKRDKFYEAFRFENNRMTAYSIMSNIKGK